MGNFKLHALIFYFLSFSFFAGNMWLKCNDLESPVCNWQAEPPSVPPSEIHIIIVERQGDPCTMCDAISSDMNRIRTNVDQIVEKMSVLNGTYKKAQTIPTLKTALKTAPKTDHDGPLLSNLVQDNRSVAKSKNHLWQRRPSSYQSYSVVNKDATASHLTVIDLDLNEKDCDGNALSATNEKETKVSWSRSSSPVTVSSTRARKRSLPNYLLSSQKQKPKFGSNAKKGNQKSKEPKVASVKSKICQVQPIAVDVQYGNSDVYSKRIRSNNKKLTRVYYSRKNSFPSYSETQALKTGDSQQVGVATLAASLPEGAFVRYSLWQSKDSKSSDRSTNSSPSDLHLDAKSMVPSSNLSRPRCDSLSSVSSPSACSDLSSLSDNTSLNKDDLGSTIDELYKALEIRNPASNSQSRIPSPTLDDDFLAEILADDPVPAALPTTCENSKVVKLKESTREPTVVKTGPCSQELDGITPSIEPMAEELLAKLVV